MVKLKGIKEIVIQPAVKAAMVSQRWRQARPILVKPAFNQAALDNYFKLTMKFEMKVTNILETKVYELPEEKKVQLIKDWLGWKDLQLTQTFIHEKMKLWVYKGSFCSTVQ